MTPEEAAKLAHAFAETARAEEESRAATARAEEDARATAAEKVMSYPIRDTVPTELSPPVFLHERELSSALRDITLLASGRNPYGEELMERLSADQRNAILRALSIVVCTIFNAPKANPSPQGDSPTSPSDPTSERPLQQYLDRMERQAILNAVAEARNNNTEAARLLGITYRAFRYRVERLNIDV